VFVLTIALVSVGGFVLSEATVAKYTARPRRPPSQTWPTFLTNHRKDIVSSDFFVVPTVFFRIRRECLDHVIILNETGLRRMLKSYFEYYQRTRTHLSGAYSKLVWTISCLSFRPIFFAIGIKGVAGPRSKPLRCRCRGRAGASHRVPCQSRGQIDRNSAAHH
jgi:hypothetical protein